jgi:hypothetical protein
MGLLLRLFGKVMISECPPYPQWDGRELYALWENLSFVMNPRACHKVD